MRLTLIIFALTVLFSFSLSAQTSKTQQKPLKFDIHKATANLEKISTQNLEILFKASIIEKIDNNIYWVKDESGKIKVNISDEIITTLGNYTETSIFYFNAKVKNFREQTLVATKITKAE